MFVSYYYLTVSGYCLTIVFLLFCNIVAAGAVDREFVYIAFSLGPPLNHRTNDFERRGTHARTRARAHARTPYARRLSTFFCDFHRFSTIFQRFPSISIAFQRFSTFFNVFQRFLTFFNVFQRFLTIFNDSWAPGRIGEYREQIDGFWSPSGLKKSVWRRQRSGCQCQSFSQSTI